MTTKSKSVDPMKLASIAGSIISAYYTRPLSLSKAVFTALGGTAAAIFISPAITSNLPAEAAAAVSFLLGIFSMSLIGVVFQVLDRIKELPTSTINEILKMMRDVLVTVQPHTTHLQQGDHDGNNSH